MPRTKSVRPAHVRTTTISVTKLSDYKFLENEFKLVRYVVPDRLRNVSKIFERVHAHLKEQIDYPYKSYRFDELDGPKRWAVYVLYPKTIEPLEVTVENIAMEWREIRLDEPELHILLKLLQVKYFRGSGLGKFVGRDNCYIYARKDGRNTHTVMEIEIKGDIGNKNNQPKQLFNVIGYAHKLVRQSKELEPGKQYTKPYYAISKMTETLVLFHQVKPNLVIQSSKKGELYESNPFEERAKLEYYAIDAVERSRGYLLDRFITDFSTFLEGYGFDIQPVQRTFQQFTPTPKVAGFKLPMALLDTVSIYDVRMQREIPIERYKELFEQVFKGVKVKFNIITELTEEFDGVLLFIMDFVRDAFNKDKPLHGKQDPYKSLYEQYPSIPKQGMNVNLNDLEQVEDHEERTSWYLNYQMLDAKDKNVKSRISVSLNQLFLKDVVMCRRLVSRHLPANYPPYIFVRKQTQDRVSYEVALYFDNDVIRFLDLNNPNDRDVFRERLATFKVDWDRNFGVLSERYRKAKSEEITRYDLIIGHDLFVEIVDLNERVLYEFDIITERQQKSNDLLSLADFKLFRHYDKVRVKEMLSRAELVQQGFLDSDGNILRPGETEKQIRSIALLAKLREYDNLLQEMMPNYPEISFKGLCKQEYWFPRIAQIIGEQLNDRGKYKSKILKSYYRRTGMFPTAREAKLTPTYQGIWFDAEDRFLVGDVNSLKPTGQAKAHLVRQFVAYQGKGKFEINSLLEATSVKFVRFNQFTVYPYFYHLIDLYIENVLQYMALD